MPGHRRSAAQRQAASTPDLRRVLRRVAYALALINLGSGGAYLLGGPTSAPSLRALLDLVPVQLWAGALALAGSVAFLAPRLGRREPVAYVGVYLLGTIAWAAYALSSWASLFDGSLLGASGPWTATGLTLLHANGLNFRNRDWRAGR